MKTLCALLLISLAGCFEDDSQPKRMVWNCPDDAETQDMMVSYAIQCYSVQTRDWKRKTIRNEKQLSMDIQEKCLEQAQWFFCQKEEME